MSTLYGPGPEEPEALRPGTDLAGLPVVDAAGRPSGEVYGTLTDADSGLIQYIDLALDRSDRHVLVPVGHTRVEREDGRAHVRLRAAVRDELDDIPSYEPHDARIDDDYERAVLAAHGRFFYGERYYAHPAFDHSGLYAGEHPIVRGPTPKAEPSGRVRLSSLPAFRVSPGEPDVRGWPVHTADGRRAGVVRDLVVDPKARTVRYVVVGERTREPHEVMLPVGFLRIESDAHRVDAPVLTADDLDALPAAPGRSITRDDEDRIREILRDRLDGERLLGRPDFSRR